jgi:hypothetical protein
MESGMKKVATGSQEGNIKSKGNQGEVDWRRKGKCMGNSEREKSKGYVKGKK